MTALALMSGCGASDLAGERHDGPPGNNPSGNLLPVGTSTQRITVDSRERTYRFHRPPTIASDKPVPLVVMLHGAAGTAEQAESTYGWIDEANRGGFVVAFPDGYKRAWAVSPTCCGAAVREGIDDAAFVQNVVAEIGTRMRIDPARTFLTGISNGGLLAYRLVCDTGLFAAVGAVATTLPGDCAKPAPVSVIHIHGKNDRTMPYGGGPGRRDNGGTGRNPVGIDGPPIPEVVALWRVASRCPEPQVTTSEAVTRATAVCPAGRAVELITVNAAGHQWPGSKPNAPVAQQLLQLDPPSTALNATEVVWRFFSTHPKPVNG